MKKIMFFKIFSAFLVLVSFYNVQAQGPVILSGLDTEWGIRPANSSHGTIAKWASVIQTGIINNVSSNPTGNILVIGGGKGPASTDHMTSFWNQTSVALGKSVVYSNSITADILTISFTGYSMISICNTADGIGKLTAGELADKSARQADIASFVNAGGGLFASSCNIAPEYGYWQSPLNFCQQRLLRVSSYC